MGFSRTISSMITEVRSLSDMENTDFVTDTEILVWLNKAYQRMHNILNNAYEMYRYDTDDLTMVTDQKDYDLPTDFLKLIKVMYVNSDDRERPLRRKDLNTADFPTLRRGWPMYYSLLGKKIRFWPVPQAGHTIRLYYVPAVADFLSTDTIDFEQYMDEYCVHYAAVKCLIKEKTNANELMIERESLKQECIQAAAPRDFSDAACIQDVEYGNDDDEIYWGV